MKVVVKYALVGGGYKIPFSDMSAEVSEDVMYLLQEGYVMFRNVVGDYILAEVSGSNNISYNLDCYEDLVERMCKKYQIPLYSISPISVSKYFSNSFIQKLLDNVLLSGTNINDTLLGLTMKGNKTFCLVEVKSGGIKVCL